MKHLFYLIGLVTVACLTGCVQTAAEDNPDQYSTETRIVTILDRTLSRGRVYQRYAIDGLPAIYSVFVPETCVNLYTYRPGTQYSMKVFRNKTTKRIMPLVEDGCVFVPNATTKLIDPSK